MAQNRAFGVPKIKTNPEDITSSGQTSRSDPVRQIDSKTPKTFVFGATVTILARLGAAYRAFSYPDYTVGSGISPDPAQSRSRALPPIGNWAVALTLPRKLFTLFNCGGNYTVRGGFEEKWDANLDIQFLHIPGIHKDHPLCNVGHAVTDPLQVVSTPQ
jgi:hypothetical protein